MSITSISSRCFTRDVAAAKRAASAGPVFITDRGRPACALLKIEDYDELVGRTPRSLLETMAAIEGGGFDFEAPTIDGPLRPAAFE